MKLGIVVLLMVMGGSSVNSTCDQLKLDVKNFLDGLKSSPDLFKPTKPLGKTTDLEQIQGALTSQPLNSLKTYYDTLLTEGDTAFIDSFKELDDTAKNLTERYTHACESQSQTVDAALNITDQSKEITSLFNHLRTSKAFIESSKENGQVDRLKYRTNLRRKIIYIIFSSQLPNSDGHRWLHQQINRNVRDVINLIMDCICQLLQLETVQNVESWFELVQSHFSKPDKAMLAMRLIVLASKNQVQYNYASAIRFIQLEPLYSMSNLDHLNTTKNIVDLTIEQVCGFLDKKQYEDAKTYLGLVLDFDDNEQTLLSWRLITAAAQHLSETTHSQTYTQEDYRQIKPFISAANMWAYSYYANPVTMDEEMNQNQRRRIATNVEKGSSKMLQLLERDNKVLYYQCALDTVIYLGVQLYWNKVNINLSGINLASICLEVYQKFYQNQTNQADRSDLETARAFLMRCNQIIQLNSRLSERISILNSHLQDKANPGGIGQTPIPLTPIIPTNRKEVHSEPPSTSAGSLSSTSAGSSLASTQRTEPSGLVQPVVGPQTQLRPVLTLRVDERQTYRPAEAVVYTLNTHLKQGVNQPSYLTSMARVQDVRPQQSLRPQDWQPQSNSNLAAIGQQGRDRLAATGLALINGIKAQGPFIFHSNPTPHTP